MANSDVKRGLVPVRNASGTPYNGACNRYHVAAAHATDLYDGDPVVLTGEADNDGVASVDIADPVATIKGVIVGFRPISVREEPGFLKAGMEGYILVADEPHLECEIQTSAPITAADVGQNAGLALGAGDPIYRRSTTQLDQGSIAATPTLPLQILGTLQRIDNPEPYGDYSKLTVRLNSNTSAGV